METIEKQLGILLVDDAVIITNRIKKMVLETGIPHRMQVASSVEQAVKLFTDQDFDIIILDIHLPGKSGIDFLRYLNENKHNVVTIMMTNQATERYRRECLQLGAYYFIDKSVDFEKITELLKKLAY